MGVDHGGRGDKSHKIWSRGDANANCPPLRFCYIGTKRSVPWPSKYAKIRFRWGFAQDPAWGAHDAPPDPLVSWEGHPSKTHPIWHRLRPTFGARHASPRIPARFTPIYGSAVANYHYFGLKSRVWRLTIDTLSTCRVYNNRLAFVAATQAFL